MVRNRKIHYVYDHQKTGATVILRSIDLDRDIDRLHEWTHYPHVIPTWNLNKPKPVLFQHFTKALQDKHQSLFIVSVNNTEIGYAETYSAPEDRLANFCKVKSGDYGLHLFIGPPSALGKGYSELILAALTDYLFTRRKAKRVFVEPNQNVKQLSILERKLGYTNLGLIKLPEKTATLYVVEPQAFYQACPHHDYPPQIKGSTISCDTTEWPIVKIHFPDYPSDQEVVRWLNEVDQLLRQQKPCIVISSFGEHYQFSASARRYQALWFKQNTDRLASLCMGMVRVTRDRAMIEKITSNAMRKGMPFNCIPASTLKEARYIASRILTKQLNKG